MKNQHRRDFLRNGSLLIAGLTLSKFESFALPFVYNQPIIKPNVPQVVLEDNRIKLSFDPEVMILNDGLQPSMLITKKGTIILQSQLSKKPLPQTRMFYPYALETVASRDKGESWDVIPLKDGDNGINIEGAIVQLKNGTILGLDTYVTPGKKPDTGEGLMIISTDDYKTLNGSYDITFNMPNADFYNSSDDAGRPHVAMRLHRRVVEMPNGDLLTTIYGWEKGDNEPSGYIKTMNKTRVMLFRSKNKCMHWDFVSTIAAERGIGTEGFAEPVLMRVNTGAKAGRLICQMRTGRDLYETMSHDDGKTWLKPYSRVFANLDVYATENWAEMFKDVRRDGVLISENPNEFIGAVVDPDLIELRGGMLVAAFGIRIPPRANFAQPEHPWNGNYLAFSLDQGDTWSQVTRLTTGVSTTHYMAVEETLENNEIYVVYDFGHWRGKEGRYTYGRRVKIKVRNS